jgi:hypothetical protein
MPREPELRARVAADVVEASASAAEIFKWYDGVPPSADQYSTNATLIRDRLVTTRGFP